MFSPRVGKGPFKRALVLENPDPTLDDHLRSLGITPFRPERTPSEAELIRLLEQEPYELIFKRSRVPVTQAVLNAAPNLFGVMLCCIGDDSVDKQACAEHGVLVTNDPVSNGRSVVEMVFGELISLSRRLFIASSETDRNIFNKSQTRRFEIRGKTLGVLGLGRIGKQVAQMGEMLGMKIAFYDKREVSCEVGETLGWRRAASIEELFRVSDAITCHISATDHMGNSNAGVIERKHFAAMGEKDYESPKIFINLARGNIHSAADLAASVDAFEVNVAMVDVFPQEPKDANDTWNNPYAGHPRILGTPHIGAATMEAQPRIARYVAHTTEALSFAGTLRSCVMSPKHTIGFDDGEAEHVLTVVHSHSRGTKKAVDDAIYNAGANNLMSAHRDFPKYGIAYETVAIDQPLSPTAVQELIDEAVELTGDKTAIRAIRQVCRRG